MQEDIYLPKGWLHINFSDLLHGIEAGKSFECLTRPAAPEEWGIIKVSAMSWGRFIETENKAVPPAIRIDKRYEITEGDLLLSRANTVQLVGASVLVKHCRPQLLLSDKSMRLKVTNLVNRSWLQKVLSSRDVREQMSGQATGTSDSMRNISQDKVHNVQFLLPPFDEQNRIDAEIEKQFSRLDAAVAAIKRVQTNLKRYRATVLRAACEGRLVPTEAELARQEGRDYEPADILLQRILTERRARWESDQLAKLEAQGRLPLNDTWKARYQEPNAPDTSALAELPEGWRWAKLDVLTDVLGGFAFESKHFSESGYQVVKMANVKMSKIDLSQRPSYITNVEPNVA